MTPVSFSALRPAAAVLVDELAPTGFYAQVGRAVTILVLSRRQLTAGERISPVDATFIRMGSGVYKAADWAAASPSFHAVPDLPADSSPPRQQSRQATCLRTRSRTVPGVPSLQTLCR